MDGLEVHPTVRLQNQLTTHSLAQANDQLLPLPLHDLNPLFRILSLEDEQPITGPFKGLAINCAESGVVNHLGRFPTPRPVRHALPPPDDALLYEEDIANVRWQW